MTTNAFLADKMRLAGVVIESDGLMTTILTRDVTTATADAFLTVEQRENHRLTVKIGRQHKRWKQLTDKVFKMLNTSFCHVGLHAHHQIVDDAVALLHHSGTNLHVAAAHLDELQGVVPRFNAADATEL